MSFCTYLLPLERHYYCLFQSYPLQLLAGRACAITPHQISDQDALEHKQRPRALFRELLGPLWSMLLSYRPHCSKFTPVCQ